MDHAIKVLVISDYRSTIVARPEAEIFIGLAKLGYEITIMTYAESEYAERSREAGIRIIDFHPEKKFNKAEIATVRKELVQGEYDIVELFNSSSIYTGIAAAKGLDTKVVLYRGYAGNVHWWDPTAYLKYLNRRVDYIVCNTRATEEVFHKQHFFDKSKTVVIEKGHDPSWYNQKPSYDMRQELNLPQDSFLLVNAANNRDMKGIPDLLEAMTELPHGSDIHLLLVGKDMETAENLKIIKGNNAENKVHFLGFREDVVQIVGGCDVFTLSSRYGEALTKAVIEAMSQKVTPIITDIPGNTELAINGESGLVVPVQNPKAMAEAIMRLNNDRALCQELGEQAYHRIQTRLSANETVNNYDKFFRRIAG